VSCEICGGEQYELAPHTTEEHSEDWVNMADARESGEVLFMPAREIYWALGILIDHGPTDNERSMVHVDRRVVQALVDALYDSDRSYVDGIGEYLKGQLELNPLKEQ
jgi:hypothetical protein